MQGTSTSDWLGEFEDADLLVSVAADAAHVPDLERSP